MSFGEKVICLFAVVVVGMLVFAPQKLSAAEGLHFTDKALFAKGNQPNVPNASTVDLTKGLQLYGNTAFAGVPKPKIPKPANADICIAPTDFMRRYHMDILSKDRDKTVFLGDRQIKASLKECIACHVVNGADNKPVTYDDPKNFCRVCHDYAAVKIDCFQCHTSVPQLTLKGRLESESTELRALANFVKGDER